MTSRPLILITNDDGVHAVGIRLLWEILHPVADLVVVAPLHEQSAASLSITIRQPLRIEEVKWPSSEAEVWSVSGTPADCIKLALSVILRCPPHLIVSGINRGNNAGRNIFYSGTVAAVMEGIMHDIPGIAFSVYDLFQPSYQGVETYITSLIHYVSQHALPSGTFLNVNFPKQTEKGIQGMRFARQGKECWLESPEKRIHPVEGGDYYWLGVRLAQFEEEEESEIVFLNQGFATVVPIHIGDLTHHQHVEQHRQQFEIFMNQRKR